MKFGPVLILIGCALLVTVFLEERPRGGVWFGVEDIALIILGVLFIGAGAALTMVYMGWL